MDSEKVVTYEIERSWNPENLTESPWRIVHGDIDGGEEVALEELEVVRKHASHYYRCNASGRLYPKYRLVRVTREVVREPVVSESPSQVCRVTGSMGDGTPLTCVLPKGHDGFHSTTPLEARQPKAEDVWPDGGHLPVDRRVGQ